MMIPLVILASIPVFAFYFLLFKVSSDLVTGKPMNFHLRFVIGTALKIGAAWVLWKWLEFASRITK